MAAPNADYERQLRPTRYAVLNGPDIYVEGHRGHDTTARFNIFDGNRKDLGTNLDWPSAWKVLMPVVRYMPDVEALLRGALAQNDSTGTGAANA